MVPIKNKTEQKQYGLLSMIAIIIGIVIGSGIFVKNTVLIDMTNSALLSTMGWIIGGLIVASMLIAFIEVSSITKLKNEQGTLASWSKHLWGKKTSKLIGIYFAIFYFPLIVSVEAIFCADQLLALNDAKVAQNLGLGEMGYFWITTFLMYFIIIVVGLIVSHSQKTSKGIMSTGTIVKVIPLFVVIFLAFIIVCGATGIASGDSPIADPETGGVNKVFNIHDDINIGITGFGTSILSILMILPAILFAFDGFLFVNSLSTETKKPSTYKTAAIIAIFIITMIYIFFSLSSYMLAPVSAEDGKLASGNFSITNVFTNIWEGPAGEIMAQILVLCVFFSILTATFSFAVSGTWSLSDLSNIGEIADVNGTLIRRNKVGLPTGAGIKTMFLTLGAITIIRFMDGAHVLSINALDLASIGDDNLINYNAKMTDYTSQVIVMTNFTFYSFVLIGAVRNRFNKKVEVEKVKGFFIFAFIAIGLMSFAVLDLVYVTISSFIGSCKTIFSGSGGLTSLDLYNTFGLIMWIMFLVPLLITVQIIGKKAKIPSKEDLEHKKYYQKAYNEHIPFDEYKTKFEKPVDLTLVTTKTGKEYKPAIGEFEIKETKFEKMYHDLWNETLNIYKKIVEKIQKLYKETKEKIHELFHKK